MDKHIGFDIDSKKTVACVVQKGKAEAHNLQNRYVLSALVRSPGPVPPANQDTLGRV